MGKVLRHAAAHRVCVSVCVSLSVCLCFHCMASHMIGCFLMPRRVFFLFMHQRLRNASGCSVQMLYILLFAFMCVYVHTCCWVVAGQQRGKEQERTEQHDLLSDFTGLYGNVMTTKAALHLHGLLVFFFFPHEVSACASVQLQWV